MAGNSCFSSHFSRLNPRMIFYTALENKWHVPKLTSDTIILNLHRYVTNFNPFRKSMYVMFLGACILIFYLVLSFFVRKDIFWRKIETKKKEIRSLLAVTSTLLAFDLFILVLSKLGKENGILGLMVVIIYSVALCLFILSSRSVIQYCIVINISSLLK